MEPGRNDPCPCGSGKKYKKCCMQARGGRQPLMDATTKAEAYAQLDQVVEEQLASGRLPEAQEALERLLAAGYSPGLCRRMIGACLLVEMPREGTQARPVNRERLVANLKKLPEMPEIPSTGPGNRSSSDL